MLAPQIISWVVFAIFCITSIGIISLHSYVVANSGQRMGLAPLHITGLAVVVCGYSAICAHYMRDFDLWFVLFISLSILAFACFGLVIVHLRRRVVDEVKTS